MIWFRVTILWGFLLLLLSGCGGNSNPSIAQMGGAIQSRPLTLSQSVATFAGSSTNGATDSAGTLASFWNPVGITTDGSNLYVADSTNNTIRRISIAFGNVSTLVGSAGSPGAANGKGATAKFNNPQGITTDGTNLYIADSGNNTIRKVSIAFGNVTTISGSAGSSGSADGTGVTARFNNPQGITTDGTTLYIADSGNNTIRKIVIGTGAVSTIAGTAGTPGAVDGPGAVANFSNPVGITTDGTNLYVTDSNNDTIRKIGIASGVVSTLAGIAGNPGIVDGTGGFAKFTSPFAITSDGRNLYVTDDASTIRKVVISTGVVTTMAGKPGIYGSTDGTGDFISFSTGVPVLTFGTARFWFPQGITTDGRNLYVADSANNMIRKIY